MPQLLLSPQLHSPPGFCCWRVRGQCVGFAVGTKDNELDDAGRKCLLGVQEYGGGRDRNG